MPDGFKAPFVKKVFQKENQWKPWGKKTRKRVKPQRCSQGLFPGLRVAQGKGPGNEVGKKTLGEENQ